MSHAGAGRSGWSAPVWSGGALRGLAQHVTHPAHRVDQAVLSLPLRLPSEVADVHLEGVARGREVVPPHLREDVAAGQHPPGMMHEQLEKGERGAGELEATFTADDLAGGRMH